MVIQFSHANGFPAPSYQALFDALAPHEISYVHILGHENYDPAHGWQPLVAELIADIESKNIAPVVGIGHSLGGVLTLFAAMQRPELFSQIILLDPPAFGSRKRGLMQMFKLMGLLGRVIPPARRSRNRRESFPDPQTAYEYWRTRGLFRRFDERSMQLYVQHGLRQHTPNEWRLAISREKEVGIFLHTPLRLGDTRSLKVPGYFIKAEKSTLLDPNDMRWLKQNLPTLEFITFDGDHMFPMEQPEMVAAFLKKLITS